MSNVNEQRQAWQLKEFDRPLLIASHFGFVPIDTPRTTEKDLEMTKDCGTDPHYRASDKASFLRTYLEKDLSSLPHPLGVVYKKGKHYSMELVGFPVGLAEAVLIRTALSILIDAGHKNLIVDVNHIGDKDSITSYERELQNYLKQAGADLPADFKKELKKDIWSLLRLQTPEAQPFKQSAPTAIAFLSSQSRSHFKEVLEYIEALEVEFRLAPDLIGDITYCSHTVFNIKDSSEENGAVLAVGYNYHYLGKRFGIKKDVTLVGTTIFAEQKTATSKRTYKSLPKPKFYLIQLGRSAKMKTLSTIELLRQERIPVHHVLGKDKLATQLSGAESSRAPYLLIIGQREALENSVTVRNVNTRAQETVPTRHLPKFLKNLPI